MDSQSPTPLNQTQDALDQPVPPSFPPPSDAAPPVASERKLIAPVWHTVALLALLGAYSYFGSSRGLAAPTTAASQKFLIVQYSVTIVFEFFLLFLVWIGIRIKGMRLRELIGGRWKSPENFLIDVGIAIGFWVIAIFVLAGLGYVLGLANPSQQKEAKQLADLIAPQGWATLVMWTLLSSVAGFVEEIVFRGYFQRQLGVITRNVAVGVVLSALIFGCAHGYEGPRRMVLIAVYGAMFSLLTLWRKSLRPGMMAHAWHDAFEGWLLRFLSQTGGFSKS